MPPGALVTSPSYGLGETKGAGNSANGRLRARGRTRRNPPERRIPAMDPPKICHQRTQI